MGNRGGKTDELNPLDPQGDRPPRGRGLDEAVNVRCAKSALQSKALQTARPMHAALGYYTKNRLRKEA